MAVRLERAHAEYLGQSKSLTVMGCGQLDFWRIAMGGNLAQEAQGRCLAPALLMLTGGRQRALGERVRALQAAGQQMRFSQGDTTVRLTPWRFLSLFQRTREQRHSVGNAPPQRIRR